MLAESACVAAGVYGAIWYISTSNRRSSRYLPKIDGKVFYFLYLPARNPGSRILGNTVLNKGTKELHKAGRPQTESKQETDDPLNMRTPRCEPRANPVDGVEIGIILFTYGGINT